MGSIVSTSPCPECRKAGKDSKGDNLCHYDDDSKTCHACGYWEKDGEARVSTPVDPSLTPPGDFQAIPDRRITEATCKKFAYTVRNGGHIAPYQKNGKVVYQALRWWDNGEKKFMVKGTKDGVELFGQHLWNPDRFSDKGRKILVITEGELDCLAAFQMLSSGGYDSPVVSICNGAKNAVSHIKSQYEWVNRWESVVICFDMDEPGREAAEQVAELFPGKAKIMDLPLKDASDMLMASRSKDFMNAFYEAKVYRPDGIIHISEVPEETVDNKQVFVFKDDEVTTRLIGKEEGEIILVGSGSGMGKSTWVRREILHDLQQGQSVGVIMLEESPEDTINELCGLLVGKPVRRILSQRRLKAVKPELSFSIIDNLTDEELKGARKWLSSQSLYTYKHHGTLDSKNLVGKIRHMIVGCGCRHVYLDHISLVVAGGGGDERQDIDALMKSLVSLKDETGAVFTVVSQFSTPDGKAYEEGAATHLNSFRGSRSMGQAATVAIGLERNQQAETDEERSLVTIRSLKARRSGYTGVMCRKYYNTTTGDFTLQYSAPDPFIPEPHTEDTLNV
jgi:twinkle protein